MQVKFLTIICILWAHFSFAQENTKKTPEEKAAKKTAAMVSSLHLNQLQEKLLYELHVKSYTSIQQYDTKEHSKKEKKKQKDIVQNLRDKEYRKILTPAQYKQYTVNEKAADKLKDAEKAAHKKEKKEKKEKEKKSATSSPKQNK